MSGFREEFSGLEPSLRLRIKRVGWIAGVWTGFILGTAAIFYFSKPYIDRQRQQRKALMENGGSTNDGM